MNTPVSILGYTTLRVVFRVLFVVTCVLATLPNLSAQPAIAEIAGDVTNRFTRGALQGAVVTLEPGSRRVLADESGRFVFTNIAPGEYRVTATYAGLDASTEAVTAIAGMRTGISFQLNSTVYALPTFSVTADREGNAASLTRQRNAGNIVNVVSLDAYGDVAAGNLGYFLQKLPGVAVHFNDGDPVGVMLRGAPPSMSMVTVDGTQLTAAASGNTGSMGDRAPVIDRTPAEFIKEVQVTKASTPDMDATGLGGAANLVTKSAFDFKQSRMTTIQAGYSRNFYRSNNPWTPSASVTHMQKFGNRGQFAVVLSPTYTKTFGARDRIQPSYTATSDQPNGVRFLDDVNYTIRSGLGTKFEYRMDDSLTLQFDVLSSRFRKELTRYDQQVQATGSQRVADYSRVNRAQIESGALPRDSVNIAAGVAPGSTVNRVELLNANWINRAAIEERVDKQLSVAFSGTKRWGATKLTGRFTQAVDSYDRGFEQFTGRRIGGVGFEMDAGVSRVRPRFTQTYGPSVNDLSAYTANQWQLNKSFYNSDEEIRTGSLDLSHRLIVRDFSVELKGGVKFQEQIRETQTWLPVWNYVGVNGSLNPGQFATPGPGYGMFRGQYAAIERINYGVAQSLFLTQIQQFLPTATATDGPIPLGTADEEIKAAYVMATGQFGPLNVVAGVRTEHTDVEARGTQTQGTTRTRITRDGGYAEYFPSLHFRYEPIKSLILRASYSKTMARPGIADVIPNTTVTLDSTGSLGSVNQNNTNLGPQVSANYDLMAEYYLSPVGVLSLGVFRKDIDGFILTELGTIGSGPDNGFGGQFEGFSLVTKRNINSAQIEGFEVGYDHQLRMLPRPFNTLAVFGNYTRLHTSGTYDEGAGALANFVPETYNVGLTYSFWRLQCRVYYNYTSGYLRAYNATPSAAAWLTEAETVGLNLQYKLTSSFNLSVNWDNIFNKYADEYSLNTNRTTVYELFGSRLNIALRGRF